MITVIEVIIVIVIVYYPEGPPSPHRGVGIQNILAAPERPLKVTQGLF